MKKLILLVVLVVFLAGCVGQQTISTTYKNDIITLEDYVISNTKPSSGSIVTIDFSVQNNGDKPVDGVEVKFFDIPGFDFISLECQGIEPTDKTCVFSRIESLDFKAVTITLQAPEVKTDTPLSVSYYLKYDYTGYRQADIPIINDEIRKTPMTKFSESSPSYGPVVLDFDAPVGRETRQGNQIIKEYWGVKERPFAIKMNLRAQPTTTTKVSPIKIKEGNIKLTLSNLDIATINGKDMYCDFAKSGDMFVSKKNITIPSTLTCNLQSEDFAYPEITASIYTEVSYTYQFTITESFKVIPVSVD